MTEMPEGDGRAWLEWAAEQAVAAGADLMRDGLLESGTHWLNRAAWLRDLAASLPETQESPPLPEGSGGRGESCSWRLTSQTDERIEWECKRHDEMQVRWLGREVER